MNTSHLPYILAIATCANLSSASKELNISQPALSKYLTKLEHELNVSLFFRIKKKLYPTPAGKRYIETAREILHLEQATRNSISLLNSPLNHQLRIGISPHRGADIFSAVYPKFLQAYPFIRLTVRESYSIPIKKMLLAGEIDLCLSNGDIQQGIESSIMENEEIVLAVPSFHALAKQPKHDDLYQLPYIQLENFRNEVFIMPEEKTALSSAIKPLFVTAGFQPQVAFTTPNVQVMYQMIRSGIGIGLLPSYTIHLNQSDDIVFYRLSHKVQLYSGFFYRTGHVFSQTEEYFKFLVLQHRLQQGANINWSAEMIGLIKKFAPEQEILLPNIGD